MNPKPAALSCAHCGQPGSEADAGAGMPWFCCRGCREIFLLLRELQAGARLPCR